ncbi:hypothetical protein P5673_032598 [Acropora cervicornis]|uniref:Uncharacterized protein n=1 Tax=Acropora cervicornis TaxID=6130 RepID=A0AAD9PQZ0_ACRCE|nr:hypothetical protein P5673_032598 [Acropora cervicornis]
MFEESRLHHKDTECVEDQCIFNGPIRTFPHFPGNWAMHVFHCTEDFGGMPKGN